MTRFGMREMGTRGSQFTINGRPMFLRGTLKCAIFPKTGQWCVYPNFDEIPKYDGLLKAKNFEVFRELRAQAGMADQARDFLMASGKLQALCYKHDIEASLRTRGFGESRTVPASSERWATGRIGFFMML